MARLRFFLIVFAPVAILTGLMVRWATSVKPRSRRGASITLSESEPQPGEDDLTIIEGIGPRVQGVLRTAGITTLDQLATTDVQVLRDILRREGFGYMDPGTWPQQAALAAAGQTEDLTALQTKLRGGRASPDDLTIIEGVGPRIAAILNEAGIMTFAGLAAMDVAELRRILRQHGQAFTDPTTWGEQAQLAAAGRTDELKALQDSLKGGRRMP